MMARKPEKTWRQSNKDQEVVKAINIIYNYFITEEKLCALERQVSPLHGNLPHLERWAFSGLLAMRNEYFSRKHKVSRKCHF